MNLKQQNWIRSFVMAGMMVMAAQAVAASTPDTGVEGVEVLTRGPVHEAFAETVVFDPEPGIIVVQAPPEFIEEIQPDQRPSGDNVAWIPGYWAWDEEEKNFLWVSGVWRNLPPGREWIPGYWAAVDTSHQWTSGYWQDAEVEEVTYLPEPPKSLEVGPSVEAASDDQTWVPGSWEYRDDRYAWRAGSWVTARMNWSWTPSYYRWTNCGYVYVDGYWDYPVLSRGVVFAPVRFHPAYYSRPGHCYSPYTAISLSVFSHHLFVRPNYCHYYFGDYYDDGYRNHYYASHVWGSRHRYGYDPIYAYQRWENRGNRHWYRDRENEFGRYRDNIGSRPARSWQGQDRRDDDRGNYRVAERYDQMVGNSDGGNRRFQEVSASERERYTTQRNRVRDYGRQRQQREAAATRPTVDRDGRARVSRVSARRSPVVGKRDDRSGKNGGSPVRVERRAAEKNATAGNNSVGKAPAARSARPAVSREGSLTARYQARQNQEPRTKPGERREATALGLRPSQATVHAKSRANRPHNLAATHKSSEVKRREIPANGARRDSENRRNTATAHHPARQATPPRAEGRSPWQAQRQQATPRRQATPQQRNYQPRQQPQPAPQRAQVRPQAQRQQMVRPQQRNYQPAPQRQASPQRLFSRHSAQTSTDRKSEGRREGRR